MKTLIFFGLLFSTSVFGMTTGEGSFAPHAGDSASFIKEQLKYQAFKSVISRELSSMNLDTGVFWQNHLDQFEDSFEPEAEKLQEQFKQKELSAKEYQNALRARRLSAMSRHGNLSQLIKSYLIKKRSRSSNAPYIRHLKMEATVDRKALARLYFKTIQRKNASKDYNRIYLSTEFQLQEENWSQVGVSKKSDFTETLKFHWKKWFEEHYKGITEVIPVDTTNWEYLKNYLRIPQSETKAGHYNNSNAPAPRQFQDGLWILVKIHLKKIEGSDLSKKRIFQIEGNLIMIDLNTRKIVLHKDFIPVQREFHFTSPHKLSSDVATMIWKLPLSTFKSKPSRTPLDIKRMGLVIRNIDSIRELLQARELLTNLGLHMSFTSQIALYSGTYGIIELQYQGDTDKALAVVRSLNGTALNKEKKLVAQDSFSFALKTL